MNSPASFSRSGEGVTECAAGDRVMASARQGGGFAEEYVGPADKVYRIPDNMSFEAAAGFIIGYGTAYFALKYRGMLQPGETLLVNGAAGGVGLAAIQVGKALGARVIACASTPDKIALAASYGADCCINYTSESVRDKALAFTDGKGVDVVFDPVGGDSLRAGDASGRLACAHADRRVCVRDVAADPGQYRAGEEYLGDEFALGRASWSGIRSSAARC